MNTRITLFGVVLIGLWLIAVAAGWVPVPPGTLHAPRWLLAIIGWVFLLAGLLAATSSGGRLATALAAALLTLLGIGGAWVAALGEPVMMRLGVPVSLAARIAFGIGAGIVFAWAAYAWRQVLRLR